MSQRPSASRPASRSPSDGQRVILPSVQVRDDLQQAGGQAERRLQPEGRGFQLQPSPQRTHPSQPAPPAEDWRSSGPTRDLGVHSILNPTNPEDGVPPNSRASGGNSDSPHPGVPSHSQLGVSPLTGTPQHMYPSLRTATSTPPSSEAYIAQFPGSRRILTPRSPSRSLSSGRGRGRASTDTQRSPFLSSRSRTYTTDAGSDMPPFPAPSQPQYGFPPSVTTPVDRRTSMQSVHGPGQAPLSQSASPSISASSHNPSSSQTSPASFMYHKGSQGPPTSSSYFPSSTFGPSMQQTSSGGGMQGMQYQGPSGAAEGPYNASQTPDGGSSLHSNNASSSRQTSASDPIQVLTITTSSGQYQVPVDVHQASRSADEKRARNAGASARFRQRRKEKEREASSAIEKMQQQTRDLERRVRETEHERDFYRGERDRLRDVVFRTPNLQHLAMQGPPSPLSMRGTTSSFPGQGSPHGGAPSGFSQTPASMGERPPRRRRIDTAGDFPGLPFSIPPASTLPPVQAPGYHPSQPGPSGPQNLPPLRLDNPSTSQGGTPTQAPSSTAGPPSFGREQYDRPWPGDSSRR